MSKPFIHISITDEGQISTLFNPHQEGGCDPVKVGIALASATRVIVEGFMREMKPSEVHREQIQALICEVYNRDMGWASDGEEESVTTQSI